MKVVVKDDVWLGVMALPVIVAAGVEERVSVSVFVTDETVEGVQLGVGELAEEVIDAVGDCGKVAVEVFKLVFEGVRLGIGVTGILVAVTDKVRVKVVVDVCVKVVTRVGVNVRT